MSGEPIQVIWDQSNVSTLMPRPPETPKSWLTGTLFGAAQQTKEKTESASKRKPGELSQFFKLIRGERRRTWKEEPEKGTRRDEHEVAIAGHSTGRLIVFSVQGVEQGARDEVLGPDHARRPNEEAATYTSEAEPCELGSEDQDKREPVSELGALCQNEVHGR
jgi:hypothetical protein